MTWSWPCWCTSTIIRIIQIDIRHRGLRLLLALLSCFIFLFEDAFSYCLICELDWLELGEVHRSHAIRKGEGRHGYDKRDDIHLHADSRRFISIRDTASTVFKFDSQVVLVAEVLQVDWWRQWSELWLRRFSRNVILELFEVDFGMRLPVSLVGWRTIVLDPFY